MERGGYQGRLRGINIFRSSDRADVHSKTLPDFVAPESTEIRHLGPLEIDVPEGVDFGRGRRNDDPAYGGVMTGLDWSKASLSTPDPARAQKEAQFLPPDPVVVTVTELTPKEKKEIAAFEKRREEARARGKAAENARRKKRGAARKQEQEQQARAEEAAAIKRRQREELREARQRELAIKIEAEEARRKSPEFIAAQQANEAQLAWIEHERRLDLIAEREPLRRRWREQLLKR